MRIKVDVGEGESVTLVVPEGKDPGEFADQIVASYAQNKVPEQSAASESGVENFRAGVGRGMVNVGRNVANLALPEGMEPEWAKTEAIQEANVRDEDLLETGAGMAGNIVGEIAAMYPVGGGLFKAAQLAKASPLAGSLLAGAGAGTVISDPSERLEGAGYGAVGGGIGHGLGKAVGRLARGVVPTTKEAAEYMTQTGEKLGIAQAAAPGKIKTIYKDIIPALPGGAGLRKASLKAESNFRDRMLKSVRPPGSKVDVDPEDITGSMGKLNQAWKEAWGEFDEPVINVHGTWAPRVQKMLGIGADKANKNVVKLMDDEVLDAIRLNPQAGIQGKHLMNLRTALIQEARGSTPGKAQQFYRMAGQVEDDMLAQLSKAKQARFKSLAKPYEKYKSVVGAAKTSDEFTPSNLLKSAKAGTSKAGAAEGAGPLQAEAALASKALGDGIPDPGFWRTLATWGLASGAGGVVGGPAGAILTPLAIVLGTKTAASQAMQQALLGNTAMQRKIAEAAAKNPQLREAIKNLARSAGGVAGGE